MTTAEQNIHHVRTPCDSIEYNNDDVTQIVTGMYTDMAGKNNTQTNVQTVHYTLGYNNYTYFIQVVNFFSSIGNYVYTHPVLLPI